MKILYVLQSPYEFTHGCWYHRLHIPANELKRQGNEVKTLILGEQTKDEIIELADVIVFSRQYKQDISKLIEHCQLKGKRVVYEMDDDIWSIPPVNHMSEIVDEQKTDVERWMKMADAITTTTEALAKVLRKFNENVFICPNAINFANYFEKKEENEKLRVVWSGSVSHYGDLDIMLDPIIELQKKYDFDFFIQGLAGHPLVAELYTYKFMLNLGVSGEKQKTFFKKGIEIIDKIYKTKHSFIPFYPPELHPSLMKTIKGDIGLCPLEDNTFNHSKSALKFYEYVALGMSVLASNVFPYKEEVGYLANNNEWVEKLEALLVDKQLRQDTYKKQREWLVKNRDIIDIVKNCWIPAFKGQK